MRKKILYIFRGQGASGAEIVIERLMLNNVKNVDAHLFISPGDFAQKVLDEHDFKITLLNSLRKLNRGTSNSLMYYFKAFRNYFSLSVSVHRYLLKNKIDIVHANTIVPASYLLPLIFYSKLFYKTRKWIWSDHDLKYFSAIDFHLSKSCAKYYSVTLAVSNAVKNKYDKSFNVQVLYNGLDLTKIYTDEASKMKFRNKEKIFSEHVFAILGQLINRKGIVELISAFKKFSDQINSNAILLIAGGINDAEEKYGNDIINVASASANIRYIGKITDIHTFYNGIDVLINNSKLDGAEPLGTTIIEALSYGKTVAVSDVGGSSEIINGKENAVIYLPDNESELIKALEIALKLSEISSVKINTFDERFDINNMVKNYNKILQEI